MTEREGGKNQQSDYVIMMSGISHPERDALNHCIGSALAAALSEFLSPLLHFHTISTEPSPFIYSFHFPYLLLFRATRNIYSAPPQMVFFCRAI